MESIKRKHIFIQLFGLFLFALALRLLHLYLIRNNPVFSNLLLDSQHYDQWARIITEKDWLSKKFPFMSPAYPYFLALIYLIFGHSIRVVAVIQLVIGSINCVLVYFIAQKVFANLGYGTNAGDKKLILSPKNIHLLGILSAGIAVLYGISIFYEGMLLKVALLNFCNLLLLLFLLYGRDKSSSIYLLVAGLLLGLSFFLRPNILLFIPFVLVWLWKSSAHAHIKKKLSLITYFCSGILVISLLFGARNYLINNELVLTSGHGGINFYIGNNAQSKGIYEPPDFVSPDTRYEHEDFVKEANRITGKNLSTMEASKFWYSQAFGFIRTHPVKWLVLLSQKFFIFWNAYEIPVNGLEYSSCNNYFPLFKIPLLSFGMIAPFSLLGIVLLFNKNNKINLLLLYVFIYVLGGVIIFVFSEYRMPVVPVLIIFASYAIYWAVEQVKSKKYKNIMYASLGLVPFFLLVNNTFYHIDEKETKAALYNNLGLIFANEKQYNKAISEFEKATDLTPWMAEFHHNLANAYIKVGRLEMAIIEYTKALQIRPLLSGTRLKLGETYTQTKQYDKAIAEYTKLLEENPNSVFALTDMAITYSLMQEYDLAVSWFEKALKVNPNFVPALKNYEILKREMGKSKSQESK